LAEAKDQRAADRPLSIKVEISPGELLDKVTILQIKCERIDEPSKLRNVWKELSILTACRDEAIPESDGITRLARDLKSVNEALWDVEDQIREREKSEDFGSAFIALARSVYRMNDKRADLKRQINESLGSPIIEEKSYEAY
jgi:hypothetical protein